MSVYKSLFHLQVYSNLLCFNVNKDLFSERERERERERELNAFYGYLCRASEVHEITFNLSHDTLTLRFKLIRISVGITLIVFRVLHFRWYANLSSVIPYVLVGVVCWRIWLRWRGMTAIIW